MRMTKGRLPMLECAVLTVLPAWWAMAVQQRARGQVPLVVLIKGLAFALFQLAVMVGLICMNAWWADLIFLFLLLATGNMVLEAVALRYPDSAPGAWWLRQKAAAARRRG